MDAELKIKIGADVIEVTKSIDRLKEQLKTFETALTKSTDSKRVDLLNRSIEKTKAIIAGIKDFRLNGIDAAASSLNKVAPASNSATNALTNFSRVAQDAPFGLIGIANNIEPLLTSFVSLKKETGSVGGAFKALGSSLLGGGGLILVTGLASAAMSILGGAFSRTGKQAKDASEDIKDANQVIRDSTAGVQGEIAKVQALAKAVQDSNKPYEERVRALNELKSINKAYFGDLTLEESQMNRLKKATDEYTKALVANAVVKGFETEIGKLSVELVESQTQLKKSGEEIIKYTAILEKAKKSQAAATATSGSISGSVSDPFATTVINASDRLSKANKKYKESAEATKELAIRYEELQVGIRNATDELLKFDSVNSKGTGDGGGSKAKPFNIGAFFRQNLITIDEDLSKLNEDFQREFGRIGQESAVALTNGFNAIGLDVRQKELEGETFRKNFEKLKNEALSTSQAFTDFLSPAIDSFFTSLANGSKTPFKALGDAIKQLLVQLAAAVAKALLFRAILSAINPGAAAGTSFLSLFSQFSGIPGLGNSANRVNTGNITGSAAQFGGGVIVGELRGSTIALSLQRTNKSFGI